MAITKRALKLKEKTFRRKGVSEVMAHALADKRLDDWKDLEMKGRNSGFKKQYYKRIKTERLKIKNLAREQGFWTPEMTRDHRILNIAYNNEDAVMITYALFHDLPIKNPKTLYPDLTYQGVVNWIALEGTDIQREKLKRYIQALSIFHTQEYMGNLYAKTLDGQGKFI